MKIRSDYVSNSSSSSFVLWGCELTSDDLIAIWKKQPGHENDNEDDISVSDVFDDLLYDKFNVAMFDYNNDSAYVGESPSVMKDSDTLRDFKQGILDKLSEVGLERKLKDIEFYSGVDEDGELSFD